MNIHKKLMIENPVLVVLLVGAAVLFGLKGLIVLQTGVGPLYRAIVLWRSERARVEDVNSESDFVKMAGTVSPARNTLTSPITGTECVLYECEVSEYRPGHIRFIVDRDGLWPVKVVGWRDLFAGGWRGTIDRFVGFRREKWKPIRESDDSVSFLLEDDTGRLLVNPTGSELSVSIDTIEVDPSRDGGESIPALANAEGTSPESKQGTSTDLEADSVDGRRRYREKCIEPGDSVLVCGPVERDSSVRLGDRNVVVRETASKGSFYITDESEQSAISRNYTSGAGRAFWSLFYFCLCAGLLAVAATVATA